MIPKFVKDRCLFISGQIKNGVPLDQQQREFISKIFYAIGSGENPLAVFLDISEKGKREIDDLHQNKIREVLSSIERDLVIAKKQGKKLSVIGAIRKNLDKANEIFGYKREDELLTEEKIRRWYDTTKYRHFRDAYLDQFSPLEK